MSVASSYDRLIAEHRKVQKCARDLEVLLQQPKPCDLETLANTRWALASTLMQHLAYEERALFAKLENHERPELREMCARYRLDLSQKFAAFESHTTNWTPERLNRSWDEYRTGALSYLAYVDKRVREEEMELFPAAIAAGVDLDAPSMGTHNYTARAFTIKERVGKK